MNAGILFLIYAVLEWSGLILIGAGVVLLLQWLSRPHGIHLDKESLKAVLTGFTGALMVVASAGVPHDLGRQAAPGLKLPLVWPVMTFPCWFFLIAVALVAVRLTQTFLAINRQEASSRLKSVGAWLVFAVLNLAWAWKMKVPVEILRGELPVSVPVAISLTIVLFAAALASTFAHRKLRTRGYARKTAIFIALLAGSVVFCLPLLWLLLTSFKEQSDNAGNGLVWIPKVTRMHDFIDSERPLVSTTWNGRHVLASVIGHGADGTVECEVERPFPLRGWQFKVNEAQTKVQKRSGIVVDSRYNGEPVSGFVRKDLAGGEREVEILRPANLAGVRFDAAPGSTEPVRQVGLRWENYSEALEWLPPETLNGLLYVRNSLWLVFASVVGTLVSCSMVAYGFSRIRFPGRSGLFALMLSTMMLPAAVTMLPRFLIWRSVGAIDTLVPVWLPTLTASAFNVFLLREFFKTVPAELEDAAKIDGCSPWRTYWQIMVPQIKPALTVIGIWTFMGAWNDFMSPLIYVSTPEKMPLSYAVQLFATDKSGEFGLMMAFATMTTIPVLIVFLLGQRYFVEGVQLSGLGGK